ncbi:TetR/AcrR family transcriptional regulator [Rhodobacteraceae bacterium LMO-12]|nr:TetR/AcrR family transcriptional regulator [Rhodobacteraceae bacterium LMO-JJ12]
MRNDAREKRAEEIEAAAYGVLEAKGFGGLSMLAVARAAKASNETLYRWYGDKQGLFAALIARNTDVVRAALERVGGGGDAMADLSRVGPILLSMLLGPRAVALNRAAAADGSGALGRALGRAGRDVVGPWIAGVMARAIEAGQLGGAEPGEMAEVWFALLIGDAQIRRVTGAMGMPGPEEIAARSEAAMRRLSRLFPAG